MESVLGDIEPPPPSGCVWNGVTHNVGDYRTQCTASACGGDYCARICEFPFPYPTRVVTHHISWKPTPLLYTMYHNIT